MREREKKVREKEMTNLYLQGEQNMKKNMLYPSIKKNKTTKAHHYY